MVEYIRRLPIQDFFAVLLPALLVLLLNIHAGHGLLHSLMSRVSNLGEIGSFFIIIATLYFFGKIFYAVSELIFHIGRASMRSITQKMSSLLSTHGGIFAFIRFVGSTLHPYYKDSTIPSVILHEYTYTHDAMRTWYQTLHTRAIFFQTFFIAGIYVFISFKEFRYEILFLIFLALILAKAARRALFRATKEASNIIKNDLKKSL